MENSFGTKVAAVQTSKAIEVHLKKDVVYKGEKFVGISKYLIEKEVYVGGVQIPVAKFHEFVQACVALDAELGGAIQ